MTPKELKQIFQNKFDVYDESDCPSMSEERFIEVVQEMLAKVPNKPLTYHAELAKIAKKYLGLDTLETQNSDGLDFKEQAVWQINDALEAAYKLGAK